MKYKKIVFVSEEDTFSSPLAKEIMKKYVDEKNIEIDSAGTVVLFPEPINPKAVAIAKTKGVDVEGYTAKEMNERVIAGNTLCLTMTEAVKNDLVVKYGKRSIYFIGEFVNNQMDIETPYGKPIKECAEVFDIIEETVKKVVERLQSDDVI